MPLTSPLGAEPGDMLLDSCPPWLDLPMSTGWSQFTESGGLIYAPLQIVKVGRNVNLKGFLKKTNAAVAELITARNNIPIAAAPKENKLIANVCHTGSAVIMVAFTFFTII